MHFHYDAEDVCDCGWQVLGTLDEDDLSYEWHTLAVWRRVSDGRVFWAVGAGCSCNDPSDIEESELEPVDKTSGAFWAAVSNFPAKPDAKPRLLRHVHRFGGYVYVTSTSAELV